ncbi:uncharacterized protein TNCV_1581831 [Trichonephila clavipes]|nr:uncharacterized protein TNCV_1581831 [Trichonephila clavipes]
MCAGDQTGCLRTSHLSQSYLDAPYQHRASTSLNSSLLKCRVYGFMRLSSYPYMFVSSIQLETRLVRLGNVFPVIKNKMSVLTGPGEAYSLVSCSQQGTRDSTPYYDPSRSPIVWSVPRLATKPLPGGFSVDY